MQTDKKIATMSYQRASSYKNHLYKRLDKERRIPLTKEEKSHILRQLKLTNHRLIAVHPYI
jgi:hypothetical protein